MLRNTCSDEGLAEWVRIKDFVTESNALVGSLTRKAIQSMIRLGPLDDAPDSQTEVLYPHPQLKDQLLKLYSEGASTGIWRVPRKRSEYCFESTVSEERSHWVLQLTQRILRRTRWVRFGTQITGWKELTEFSPGARWGPENSLSSVFETVLSETAFGPSPNTRVGCWVFFSPSNLQNCRHAFLHHTVVCTKPWLKMYLIPKINSWSCVRPTRTNRNL